MKIFSKWLFFWLFFLFKLSSVGSMKIRIPGTNRNTVSVINKMAVEMLTKCYADNREVVMHGDSDKSTIKSLQESESLPMIEYNDASSVDEPVKLRLYHNSFVMTPRSVSHLEEILLSFKMSLRWNVMAPFLMLDKSNRQCKNAKLMLKKAWDMNLVKSFFLCVDPKEFPMIYTYNPYSTRAPQSWKQISSPAKLTRWTMYAQQYNGEYNCTELDFDRTKYLDGSTIRVVVESPPSFNLDPNEDYDESMTKKLHSLNVYTLENLKYSLNVSFIFNVVKLSRLANYAKKTPVYDVSIFFYETQKHSSYPVFYLSYHIVANKRGFYTPVEKIQHYYGLVTLVSMCIIVSMTFTVIVLSERRRRWAFATFEVLRLLINTALHTRIDTIALRIFFSMVFLYFLIIHATFQGYLTGFLTKQEYRKNAETMEDLKDSRIQSIHVTRTLESFFDDPIIQDKLVLYDSFDCISQIIGDDSAICIRERAELLKSAYEEKFHVSKAPIFRQTLSYFIRNDWPLKERMNLHLMWLASSGQSIHDWRNRWHAEKSEKLKRIAAQSAVARIRPINISMLEWIFLFLLVGLKLATIFLGVERRIRAEDTRRRDNRLAALQNMENRRRQLINKIILDDRFTRVSRPLSV